MVRKKVNQEPYASVVLVTAAQPENEAVRVPLLYETVHSMLKQPGFPMELIVVDNGGTVSHRQAVDQIESQPETQHVIHCATNYRMTGGWKLGFAIASGDYLVNVTDDLWFGPNWLHKLLCPFFESQHLWFLSAANVDKYVTALYIGRSRHRRVQTYRITEDGGEYTEWRVETRAGAHCWGWRRADYAHICSIGHAWKAKHYGDTAMANALSRDGYMWVLPAKRDSAKYIRDTNIATNDRWDFEEKRLVKNDTEDYVRPWNYKDKRLAEAEKREHVIGLWAHLHDKRKPDGQA